MNTRGQVLPFGKWFTGLFLLFSTLVVYEFFSPIVDTTLPNAAINANVNPIGLESISSLNSNFTLGMFGLGIAYLLYIFIGGLPGQSEDQPL